MPSLPKAVRGVRLPYPALSLPTFAINQNSFLLVLHPRLIERSLQGRGTYCMAFFFLGLHPMLVERPLQGRGFILSGLMGRFYQPRPTAWDMSPWLWAMVFIHAVYDGVVYFLGLHPRLIERPLQGR